MKRFQETLLDLYSLVGKREIDPRHRKAAVSLARGRVLEIGFGEGANLPHYGDDVIELLALEPSLRAFDRARARIETVKFPVRHLESDCETLAISGEPFDSIVSTFTLCSVRDPALALSNVRRALRPGGTFYFFEHGRSDEPSVARMQRLMTCVCKCTINRRIDRLLTDAGFRLERLEKFYSRQGPRVLTFMYRGAAS